jgi:hypothetical protein
VCINTCYTYFNSDPRSLYNAFDFGSDQYVIVAVADEENVEMVTHALETYHITYEQVPYEDNCPWPPAACLKVAVELDTMALLMQGIAPEYWALHDEDGTLIGSANDGETFLMAGEKPPWALMEE